VEILLIGLILGVGAAIWFARAASKANKKSETDAPKLLDELFNGEAVVTYESGFAAMNFDTVVKGALERGYDLHSKGDRNSYGMQKLVFTKKA